MSTSQARDWQAPVKDEHAAHPVASAWRPAFRNIVSAIVRGDGDLARGIESVAPVAAATAKQIERYIADFGETLTELPDDTWSTSASQWMGTHWDVIVDLWTVESGPSDMILLAHVFETEGGFRIDVRSVYVS